MKKYLVTVFITILLLLVQSVIYAQSDNYRNDNNPNSNTLIELSIIKNSESPLTSNEHLYVLKAVNKSDKPIMIQVIADNVTCNNKTNTLFQQKVYRNEPENTATGILGNITIPANSFIEFNVKLLNTSTVNFNSWNCTEVKAKGINTNIFSNSILIESFIPDPKNFR